MTTLSQASKGTIGALQDAKKWALTVGEAVAGSRGAISVLENLFTGLPIAGPITQVLGIAADVAILTVERAGKEAEVRDLVPRCQAIARDVVRALFFSLDFAAVEDSVVEKLFLTLQKCCNVARSAEQFVMESKILQYLAVEDVSTLLLDVKDIEAQVTSLRILQYAQENHARGQRLQETQEIVVRQALKEAFRPALIVPPVSCSATMDFSEVADTPESGLKKMLFDDRSTSGLVAVVGMTGVGKTTMLSSIVKEPSVRRYFDGGIYEMRIGGQCSFDKLKLELVKAIHRSGGKVTSEKLAGFSSLYDAIDLAREWFFGHRCLFVWDDIESSPDALTGYVRELRSILDLIVGSRALFSTRDSTLANNLANPRDIVQVVPRSSDVSERIFYSHAAIPDSEVAALKSSPSRPSFVFLKDVLAILQECAGLPLHLAVCGKAIALTRAGGCARPLHACKKFLHDGEEIASLRNEALTTSFMDTYAGFEATVDRDLALCKVILVNEQLESAVAENVYFGLCAIRKDQWISEGIAARIWGLTRVSSLSVLAAMRRYNLLETREHDGEVQFRIHGLLHAYCEKKSKKSVERPPWFWHQTLLNSYMNNTKEKQREWWDCKTLDDGYLRQSLIYHLVKGKLYRELGELLLDCRWVQRRLQKTAKVTCEELRLLQLDYETLKSLSVREDVSEMITISQVTIEDLALALSYISQAIRLARSSIMQNPQEYGFQICTRLVHVQNMSSVRLFLESWKKHARRPLARSVRQSLTLAGQSLVQSVAIGWVIKSVAYIPNTELVLAVGQRGAVLVDLEKGAIENVLSTCEYGKEVIESVEVNEGGSHAIFGWADGTIDLWNLRLLKFVKSYAFPGLLSLAFTADGKEIVVGSEDGDVHLLDLKSGRPARGPFHGHSKRVTNVATGSDCRLIASGSDDHTVRIWDKTGTTALRVIKMPNRWIRCVAWTSDMKRIVAGTEQNDIWVCDADAVMPPTVIKASNWINSVRVTRNSQMIVSASHDGTVQLWDLVRNVQLGEPLRGHLELVTSVSIDSEEKHVVSSSYDGTLKQWRLKPNIAKPSGHARGISCLAINFRSNMAASGSYDQKVKLFDLTSGETLHNGILVGPSSHVQSVAFSPNGGLLACGHRNGTIAVWDTPSAGLVHEIIRGHRSGVRCLSFSPDGRFLASGSEDKTVKIWDCRDPSGSDPLLLLGHKNWVVCVCYIETGQFLVSGSFDRTVRIWNSASGDCVEQPLRIQDMPVRLKFSEHDSMLTATLRNSKSQSWHVGSERNTENFATSRPPDPDSEIEHGKLSLQRESSRISTFGGRDPFVHLDYDASCEPLYDNKHHRLWAGLHDGTVAAIELLE
ncbi:WD40-repeat containing protein [Chondrus crispus]|uniref:WD40-repeat containing protein n=1 Tax=Chondrus crispus TaxID=2769 RepID=R7QCZ9_CHOCR|nr:WD40-repeat containing protein [Chondrus crispus]CDF35648.1 WD40-repeat containing protein [Chondrus crispus]|eukprot:XP_005715467.1 WD40-repeat containing protein [Chondrus crispus]